jgi:hypothetical protein
MYPHEGHGCGQDEAFMSDQAWELVQLPPTAVISAEFQSGREGGMRPFESSHEPIIVS